MKWKWLQQTKRKCSAWFVLKNACISAEMNPLFPEINTFSCSPGDPAVLWVPGLHFWHVKAPVCQVRGHGPLCKVLLDPATGGQPSWRGSAHRRGGQPGLEGGTSGPGVAAYRSLCLRSPWLVWLQGMRDYVTIYFVKRVYWDDTWLESNLRPNLWSASVIDVNVDGYQTSQRHQTTVKYFNNFLTCSMPEIWVTRVL